MELSGKAAELVPLPSYLNSFQNAAPAFLCRPDFVQGIPVARDTLRLAFVTPVARFQLNPPRFITRLDFLRIAFQIAPR